MEMWKCGNVRMLEFGIWNLEFGIWNLGFGMICFLTLKYCNKKALKQKFKGFFVKETIYYAYCTRRVALCFLIKITVMIIPATDIPTPIRLGEA